MKRVGFFGGSFDPIHHGHVFLAIQFMEMGLVDEVLFCPANCSPYKKEIPPASSGLHRLEMIRLAIRDIPNFSVTDEEILRSDISYTVDTLRSIKKKNTDVSFRMILAEDTLLRFDEWKEVDDLVRLAPPLIGGKGDDFSSYVKNFPPFLLEILKTNFYKLKKLDVSSTDVRARIQKKMYCGHLTFAKVLDYIYAYKLYSLR
jgi:nicotinate-nucleotide adenylyltransferase